MSDMSTGEMLWGAPTERGGEVMKYVKVLMVIVAAVVLVTGQLCAVVEPKPSDPVKWSQRVDLENGYDEESYWHIGTPRPQVVIADDWKCLDGLPISDFHWWGSYPTESTSGLIYFDIAIHADIPATAQIPSHPDPDNRLWRDIFAVDPGIGGPELVTETWYATSPVDGHDIYQYNLHLKPDSYIEQEQGKIYWIGIAAALVDENTTWGWHTGLRPGPEGGLDDAVRINDYDWDGGGTYTDWEELFDDQGSVQMAFELTTVAEPVSMTLALLGSSGLLLLRRRWHR